MAVGDNMKLTRSANAFRIWRAASSVNWDCTAEELATELGLHKDTVFKICKLKGWKLVDGQSGFRSDMQSSVDKAIKK